MHKGIYAENLCTTSHLFFSSFFLFPFFHYFSTLFIDSNLLWLNSMILMFHSLSQVSTLTIHIFQPDFGAEKAKVNFSPSIPIFPFSLHLIADNKQIFCRAEALCK